MLLGWGTRYLAYLAARWRLGQVGLPSDRFDREWLSVRDWAKLTAGVEVGISTCWFL